ncbi:uncharacterized protein LOC112269917 [Brachypodium distachyon]|uniref:DUF1618 domain-containing protein n=1 Tax=Brachypodium distachyon TaxID=15368 RepID=A0A0Q3S904_BRADI|nr:uncharacterized protein LOC112269917 [Brachypodium distachyon]KQK21482.1 hypothetical protein BRADI_1g61020v3 [Brachypodium distachyon]|eukprot:XP_024313197.1 uncharacterized protein LOC112269917 [Brachypodium distachyon]
MEIQSNRPLAIPSWVLMDQIFLYDDPGSFRIDDEASAVAEDTNGEPVRVSFNLHSPPGSSNLCIYGPAERKPSFWDTVVAAHDNTVLFRIEVHFDGLPFTHLYAMDYFIYRAFSSSAPKLSLLPRCYSTYDEIMEGGGVDASWRGKWRMVDSNSIGLLLAGEEDIVVAELKIDCWTAAYNQAAPLEAELFRIRSSSNGGGQWELTPTASRDGKVRFQDILGWETHKVVPFTTYLCWADYNRGVLFCNVCNKVPDLQYLQFPGNVPSIGSPKLFRTVCVTDSGKTMKFVNVVRSRRDGILSCPNCKRPCDNCRQCSGFTISFWTLKVKNNDMDWVDEVVIRADDLWAMEGYDDELPDFVPQFPLVSMEDPHILYFVLSNLPCPHGQEKTWIVTLDMVNKKILRYDDDKALPSDNIFNGIGFFPSNFSNYLTMHSQGDV